MDIGATVKRIAGVEMWKRKGVPGATKDIELRISHTPIPDSHPLQRVVANALCAKYLGPNKVMAEVVFCEYGLMEGRYLTVQSSYKYFSLSELYVLQRREQGSSLSP